MFGESVFHGHYTPAVQVGAVFCKQKFVGVGIRVHQEFGADHSVNHVAVAMLEDFMVDDTA